MRRRLSSKTGMMQKQLQIEHFVACFGGDGIESQQQETTESRDTEGN